MDKKQKVLIIDDNGENIKIAAKFIKSDEVIIWTAMNGKIGIEVAKEKHPDIILLDIQMPEMDGFEVCKILKADKETENIPIIFMTARTDDESIENAFKVGAVDYIVKPIRKTEIIARVRTHLKLAQTIKELEKAAYTDGLTKLYNHKKIFESLDLEIKREKRYKNNLSVMMVDIDFFKTVNDTYGHYMGDIVLEKLSEIIKATIRGADIAGRYGGEEFLIIFPEISEDEAFRAGERLRKNIEAVEFENRIKITISGGVAEYIGETALELIEKADRNLYRAKENGRNRIER